MMQPLVMVKNDITGNHLITCCKANLRREVFVKFEQNRKKETIFPVSFWRRDEKDS